MMVDVRSLGTFNRLAHEGAEHAANSLARLTSLDPCVEATQIDLVSREALGDSLGTTSLVGVEISFDGGVAGKTVLAFERDGLDPLLRALPGPTGESEVPKSTVEELGNILLAGLVDGWADYLGTTIDITPPTYVEGFGRDVLPASSPTESAHDQVFALTSRLHASGGSTTANIYMFPEYDSFADVLAARADGDPSPIPLAKLAAFNQMTTQGAHTASDTITAMTDIETTVEISRLSFVPIEAAPKRVGTEEYVGTVVEFDGVPSGYVVVLFDEPSARSIVDELLANETGDVAFDGMGRSAVQELGNVVTSGVIDGWANVLETTIEMSPPQFVHDIGQAILDPIAVRLGRTQSFAFMLDSTIKTPGRQFECEVFALPDEAELRRALASLSVGPVASCHGTKTPFPQMEASYDDI